MEVFLYILNAYFINKFSHVERISNTILNGNSKIELCTKLRFLFFTYFQPY